MDVKRIINSQNQSFGFFFILFLSIIFISIFYGKILISPNHYQFSNRGDAIKNYYTYAYYIQDNPDAINFRGMNYPYGEHFLYTDCTPVLAVTLKVLSYIFPGITAYSIGILNFLLIISFVISAIFIYLILKELEINNLLAVLSAVAIMALSPQIFRLTGHLALGFGFFIPLTWYLLIRFEKSLDKKKYGWLIGITLLLLFFVHAYLGMIAASMVLSYQLAGLIFNYKRFSKNKKNNLILFASAIAPVIIFRLFIYFTDTHYGRTDNPWGFFVAFAELETVFLPNHRPLKPVIDSFLPPYEQTWEGWAYIGLVSLIMILFYFFVSIKQSVQKKKFILDSQWLNSRHLQLMIIGSLFLLFFSMAYPFRFHLEFLLDYLKVLKQFRAVGRFAWVFYFVITVSSVYIINNIAGYFIKKQKKTIAYLIIIIAPLLYLTEALPYHIDISKKITQSVNMFDKNQLDKSLREGIDKIDPAKYQAILPLPFFYIGSENFMKNGSDKIYLLTQVISYHTGLPIMGAYLTRTSIWESKNIMQVMSPGYYQKKILPDIYSKKPFLIVYSNQDLSQYEKAILDRAKQVFTGNDFKLFSISKSALFKNTAREEIEDFEKVNPSLFPKDGFLTNDTTGFLYYDSFEQSPSKIAFRGKGAFKGPKKNWNKIAVIEKNRMKKGEKYTVAFWIYNQGKNFGQDQTNSLFLIQERKGDKVKWISTSNPMHSEVINGDWTLVEQEFTVNDPEVQMEFIVKGDDNSKKTAIIDDVFIYKSNTLNYKVEKEKNGKIIALFKNDQEIVLPDYAGRQ